MANGSGAETKIVVKKLEFKLLDVASWRVNEDSKWEDLPKEKGYQPLVYLACCHRFTSQGEAIRRSISTKDATPYDQKNQFKSLTKNLKNGTVVGSDEHMYPEIWTTEEDMVRLETTTCEVRSDVSDLLFSIDGVLNKTYKANDPISTMMMAKRLAECIKSACLADGTTAKKILKGYRYRGDCRWLIPLNEDFEKLVQELVRLKGFWSLIDQSSSLRLVTQQAKYREALDLQAAWPPLPGLTNLEWRGWLNVAREHVNSHCEYLKKKLKEELKLAPDTAPTISLTSTNSKPNNPTIQPPKESEKESENEAGQTEETGMTIGSEPQSSNESRDEEKTMTPPETQQPVVTVREVLDMLNRFHPSDVKLIILEVGASNYVPSHASLVDMVTELVGWAGRTNGCGLPKLKRVAETYIRK